MPTRERVQTFIDTIVGGRFLQSIDEFYADDASAQENLKPPRRGRAMTSHDGVTRRLDELALQTWRGDRIAGERFFYDPGSIALVGDEAPA